MNDMDVTTLAEQLASAHPPQLLDVREAWEYDTAKLPNATLMPLATLQHRFVSLDPAATYVVYCHHGGRSAMATAWLREQGFTAVANLEGGIEAWSVEVDPTVPRY